MRTLMEALNSRQEDTAREALKLFLELAGTEPRFLRRQIIDVVGLMLQVAEAETLEEGMRHLAVEFVITLAEARERGPGVMRKLRRFVSRLFAILMKMLLDIEDEPAWHGAETEDEDPCETGTYSVSFEQLPAYLSAREWQKHLAALISLAQIAQGVLKGNDKEFGTSCPNVIEVIPRSSSRLRWAAINALVSCLHELGMFGFGGQLLECIEHPITYSSMMRHFHV